MPCFYGTNDIKNDPEGEVSNHNISQSHHTFLLNVLLVDLLKVKLCFLVARATGGGHSCEDC